MRMMKRLNSMRTTLALTMLLAGLVPSAWAQVGVGIGGTAGSVGGELRGPTVIEGKVLCAQCTLEDVQAAQPRLTNLYELRHPQEGKVVMQIAPRQDTSAYSAWWQSDGAIWWQSVVGPGYSVSVRAPRSLFRQLMAEENLLKQVQLSGLLRRTRMYDVNLVTYLESTPGPLAFSRQTQAAAQRAQAAAERADAAASRAQRAAERVEHVADRLTTMADTTERAFTTTLSK
jgi:hypothetical protein